MKIKVSPQVTSCWLFLNNYNDARNNECKNKIDTTYLEVTCEGAVGSSKLLKGAYKSRLSSFLTFLRDLSLLLILNVLKLFAFV